MTQDSTWFDRVKQNLGSVYNTYVAWVQNPGGVTKDTTKAAADYVYKKTGETAGNVLKEIADGATKVVGNALKPLSGYGLVIIAVGFGFLFIWGRLLRR